MMTLQVIPRSWLWAALCAACVTFAPLAAMAESALGLWRTEPTDDGHLEVQVAPCGAEALCGTILRARDPSGHEQPYPHTGRQMIWAMVPDGPDRWRNGRIWDPRNDRTFNSRMEVQGNRLMVAGCVLGICQRQTWQRVN
jgi:uncharacterized protein (DUF2147 family)